jgi:autotransporter-associated beta strand protein
MSLMPRVVVLPILVFLCRNGLRRCTTWKLALAACCVGITANSAAGGTNGIWTRTTSGGAWSTTTNWATGIVANGTDGVADFSTLNITADETVHLDTARTIGQLKFGDTTPSNIWILDNNGNSANVLTLSVSSGAPTITVVNDQATISAVLSGTQGFADAGAGTLVISGANTYSGTLTINSGSTLNAVWGGRRNLRAHSLGHCDRR